MNKIAEAFDNRKAFIAYLMAGDPTLEQSAEYILTLQEAGADLIEIGIPFSDPIAEGEVIQAANIRALSGGATLEGVFQMVASIQNKLKVPVVFMTYLNPVFVYGYERFFQRSADCGVSGIIIPDMPFEEQDELKEKAQKYQIEVVTLIAPTSTERIAKIAQNAEGFIYLVSSMGVTGIRKEISANAEKLVSSVKKRTTLPVALGFGISTPEQVQEYSKYTDGVIVGSAIVKLIGEYGDAAQDALRQYVKSLKKALTQ